jgi:hypothetical protein
MLPSFARSAGNALGATQRLNSFASPKGMLPVAGAPKLSGGSPPRAIGLSNPRSFKRGGVVKKGGVAKVHRGERIVSKRRYSAAKSILGGKKKTARLVDAAGKEIKNNPPKILARTARKLGAKQAAKQKVAIMLSKARAAGANIPEKS